MWTILQGMTNEAARRLQTVKLLHTVVWAVFAGCVLALPWLARHNQRIFGSLYATAPATVLFLIAAFRIGH